MSESEPAPPPLPVRARYRSKKDIVLRGCALGCIPVATLSAILIGVVVYLLYSKLIPMAWAYIAITVEDAAQNTAINQRDLRVYEEISEIADTGELGPGPLMLGMTVVFYHLEDGQIDEEERTEAEAVRDFIAEHPRARTPAVNTFLKDHPLLEERVKSLPRDLTIDEFFIKASRRAHQGG
jgi:hypothetical protein